MVRSWALPRTVHAEEEDMRPIFAGLLTLVLLAGCASTQLQTYNKPVSPERTYGAIKKIAVLPFDTVAEAGVGPKNVENALTQRLMSLRCFDVVKEPRYVSALMKKLKLRNAESLDKEIVQKIGQELQVDAILVGALFLFGEDEKSRITEFSMYLNILDVTTGDIVWAGSSFVRSSTTWGEVFGLSEGPSVNELANEGMIKLAYDIDNTFSVARKAENKILMSQAAAAVKVEEEEETAKPADEKDSDELLLKVKPK